MPTRTRGVKRERQPTAAQQRAAAENRLFHKRSAALTLLQTAGRWEPFVGPTGKVFWHVPSERTLTAGGKSDRTVYTVYVEPGADGAMSCTCPNFASTHLPCKHVIAVKTFQRVVKTYDQKHRAAVAAAVQRGGSARASHREPQRGATSQRPAEAAPGRR